MDVFSIAKQFFRKYWESILIISFLGLGQPLYAKTVNAVPPIYQGCAKDFGTCNISGNWTGYYGANSTFVEISGAGNFTCLPANLKVADPVPGVQKTCYVTTAKIASAVPPGFKDCAKDFGTCTVSGNWTGYYGANTTFVEISGSGNFSCPPANLKIGDPVPNVQKTCFVKADVPASTSATPAAQTTANTQPAKLGTPAPFNPNPSTPDNEKPKDGDNSEVLRQKKMLENCITQVDDYKLRADSIKELINSKKISGLVESKQLKEDYTASLNQYNDFKTKKYPPNKDSRFNGFIDDQLSDCSGASDGFKNYWESANIDNDRVLREFAAANRTLTPEETKMKPQIESCIAKVKTLQQNNNTANENSKTIFKTNHPILTTWAKMNGKIEGYLNYYSVVYTAANLSDCQKLAADTTVSDEYFKYTGQRAQQVKNDAAADQAEAAAKAAAAEKKAADEAAARKAQIEAEAAAKAAAEAADKDPAKIKECLDTVRARRDAIGTRYFSKGNSEVALSNNYKPQYDMWTKQIDASISNMINSKETRLRHCLTPWPELDQLEAYVVKVEKISNENRQKELDKKLKEEAEARVKAKAEYDKWLREHPTEIPVACSKGCMVRHAGPGPKEKECERLCAITSTSLKNTANYIVDQTVVKALDEGLSRLGVTKALCEAATGKMGEIIAQVQKPIDQFKDKIKDASEAACVAAKGSAARCRYVGRFLKAVSDAKSCSDTAGTLKKSLDATSTKIAEKDKLLKKSKNGGGVTKEEESVIKDAALEVGTESVATCESPKASDLIAAIMEPCLAAASGAAWLTSHAGEY